MSTGGSQTPPGWYPNPENPAEQRWWDGTQWGPVHVPQPVVAPEPPAPAPPSAPTTYQPPPATPEPPPPTHLPPPAAYDASPGPTLPAAASRPQPVGTTAPAPDDGRSKRRLVIAIIAILLLLLLIGVVVVLLARRPPNTPGGSGGGPTVSIATAPATKEGLEDSVRSYWSALLNRDFPTALSYRTSDCRSRRTLDDEREKSTAVLTVLESQAHKPVDASLTVGEIGTRDVSSTLATVTSVELTGADGTTVKASTTPTTWVYEDGAWRTSTCS